MEAICYNLYQSAGMIKCNFKNKKKTVSNSTPKLTRPSENYGFGQNQSKTNR